MRSVAVCLGVALTILMWLGCQAGEGDGPRLVATWNGGFLDQADYESWLAVHRWDDSPEAIREHVFVRTLADLALERGAENDPVTRFELDAMRQRVLLPVLRSHVVSQVVVTDEEVEEIREAHPEAFQRPQKYSLSNIFKRFGPDAADAGVRAQMEDIRLRLLDGEDFAKLARVESESQSRFRDGHLGFVDPDELPDEVATAITLLEPGELSGIVEHGEGLTIFRCDEIREGTAPTADEVRSKIRANLTRLRTKQVWASYQQDLLAEADPRIDLENPSAVLVMDGLTLSVDDAAILMKERSSRKDSTELAPEQQAKLLQTWAAGIVGVRRAAELGLDREPDVADALRWRRMDVLAHHELVRMVDERLAAPSDDVLRRQFQADGRRYREPSTFEVAVIDFGSPDGADGRQVMKRASDVAQRLQDGELSFDDAARRYSNHPSAVRGGLMGWRSRRQLVGWSPIVGKAVSQMQPGETTGLLRLKNGLWIIELRDIREARPMTFEAALPRLRDDVRRQQIRDLERVIREEQLAGIGLEIVDRQPVAVVDSDSRT